jgi:hypothetical protein
MCLDALPKQIAVNTSSFNAGANAAIADAYKTIAALIPKPDSAEALRKAWVSDMARNLRVGETPLEAFTRWLFETGRIK